MDPIDVPPLRLLILHFPQQAGGRGGGKKCFEEKLDLPLALPVLTRFCPTFLNPSL